MNALLYGIGLGLALVATPFLQGCANGFVYDDVKMMDAGDKCIESHTWSTTGTGYGVSMQTCSTVHWYAERRVLDAKAVSQ